MNQTLYEQNNSSTMFPEADTNNSNLLLTNDSLNNAIMYPDFSAVNLSYSFQFWFALVLQIPSVICYVLVLTYILTKKTERQALHNHSILILLFLSFSIVLFDFSWKIDSYRRQGNVWPQVPFLCEVWWLIEYGLYDACTVILAWSSFHRHILIFHSNLVSTKRKRLFIHYLPLTFIFIYLIIYYICAIFFPPCENEYDFTSPVCGAFPCYFSVPPLILWIVFVHGVAATLLIAIFNVTLLVRVLWQRHLRHRDWKKCRKMTFQLLSVCTLYLMLNLPLMLITMVQYAGYPDFATEFQLYLVFFTNIIQYLLPFVCLISLPGIWIKIATFFPWNTRRIMPIITTINRRNGQ
ncbi:unnamed protein product [Adineta steineri]|uniref:G-protein coupled receptors family 1 profile domain-containing protein n=1 Tax=Adineta steineri TaxID=433720 RepID=A0A819CCI8_9BILA|nr:unnamed protein product [Adineta steineri]CAF3816755.1 unnamed protein product [Adineta steineri]